MTDEMMALQGLLEKTSDADLLREMLGFAAERLMALAVGSKPGAPWGERHAERLVQRNGYRERVRETRAGRVELRILKPRPARACWPCPLQGCGRRPPGRRRLVFSGFPGAAPAGGEGADRGHPRSLYPRRLDTVDGRPGQGSRQGLLALSLAGIGAKACWP